MRGADPGRGKLSVIFSLSPQCLEIRDLKAKPPFSEGDSQPKDP